MDKQTMLPGGVNDTRNINFYQIKCDSHEYTWVTQTTTINDGSTTKEVSKTGWMQCKKCGHIIPTQTL